MRAIKNIPFIVKAVDGNTASHLLMFIAYFVHCVKKVKHGTKKSTIKDHLCK
jgi:hypothetical protein